MAVQQEERRSRRVPPKGDRGREVKGFHVVMQRLERLARTLRETLATERAALVDARTCESEQRARIEDAEGELAGVDARIDMLLSGAQAVRIDDVLAWQDQRMTQAKKKDALVADLPRLEAVVQACEADVARTQRAILQNEARLDVCRKRIDALHLAAQRVEDDVADDEAEEGAVVRYIARQHAARIAEAMG
ncbi:hypothetical protein [Robbsia andropogonis]|uniref:hypothetical protein n=1 Tax=Robbsia andropogonis TaxID=28092 RepID=UPI0004651634|nr:hypothetical protein [Robbsia andropogonis]MCP1119702.1 hypothetical protein [Robbsia andropogonis]MCP1129685.1 hypothetical protein [Robbsia andropogonis]